jgi:hypothetical protein
MTGYRITDTPAAAIYNNILGYFDLNKDGYKDILVVNYDYNGGYCGWIVYG